MVIDGKEVRIRKIRDNKTGHYVIVPMDHGVSSGPIKGMINMKGTIDCVVEGGATAIVVHKGISSNSLESQFSNIGVILHLSASTSLDTDPNSKTIISSVDEALQMGADAVSVHINVGAESGKEMIQDLGLISQSCREWRMPLLAMMYPRGPDIKDPFDVDVVKHVARLGAELGADIVKTNYTGSLDTFKEVIKGCSVPVVIAGGPKVNSDREVLQMVFDAMRAGAAGVSIGRNVFQHNDIAGITKAISKIVLEDADLFEASREIIG